MQQQADSGDLSFLDGYLFRIMVHILRTEGVDESGLYNFYRARVESVRAALSHYDRMLVEYVLGRFDSAGRRIVHGGIGLGTLASALAYRGYTVAGVEHDGSRLRAAGKVHAALAEAWPAAAERYSLIGGEFPGAVTGTAWMGPDTVLIFTNCVATWSEELRARIMQSMRACGDVILDTRLFETIKDTPEERQKLVEEIEALGFMGSPIAESSGGAYYYHFKQRDASR